MPLKHTSAPLLIGLLFAAPAVANTYTVDTTADTVPVSAAAGPLDASGHVSLRSAIMAANAHAGPDTIALPSGATIVLTRGPADMGVTNEAAGDLNILDSLTIQGNGAKVSAAGIDRVFDIQRPGASAVQVAVSDLTVTGGQAQGVLAAGGGFRVRAAGLDLTGCTVIGNAAGPSANGGAISVAGLMFPAVVRGSLSLDRCVLRDNTAGAGADILSASSDVSIRNSTLAAGSASDFGGGGLAVLGDSTVATLYNTTVSGNSAAGGGGGIVTFGSGTLSLASSTLAGNSAALGGGINQRHAVVNLADTIVAANAASLAGADLVGSFFSGGYNLVGSASGAALVAGTGDQIGGSPPINPLLGPLQDNGGGILTRALLPGSPAIDAGRPLAALSADARGVRRPQDGNGDSIARADIGAYEVILPYTALDAARALRIAGGILAASLPDLARLDVSPAGGIAVPDAVVIVRKAAGLAPNP